MRTTSTSPTPAGLLAVAHRGQAGALPHSAFLCRPPLLQRVRAALTSRRRRARGCPRCGR